MNYKGRMIFFLAIMILLAFSIITVFATPTFAASNWQKGVTYQVGDHVQYEGSIYETRITHSSLIGWEPATTPTLWKAISESDDTDKGNSDTDNNDNSDIDNSANKQDDTQEQTSPKDNDENNDGETCITPSWDASTVYLGGDSVSYDGKVFQAKWWTKGTKPDTSKSWGVWEVKDDCSVDDNEDSNNDSSGPDDNDNNTGTDENDNNGSTNPDDNNSDSGDKGDTDNTTTPEYDGDIAVGETVLLTDDQVDTLWDGINPAYSANKAEDAVKDLITKEDYQALFPYRIGSPQWHEFNKGESDYNPQQEDYYSYDNLIAAVKEISNIKYKIVHREGSPWLKRVYRFDKRTDEMTFLVDTKDFDASWNQSKELITQTVDFGAFLREGTKKDRKRDLAAFLANISHETGGGWDTAPGGMLAWGLYYNEEVGFAGTDRIGYVSDSAEYPAVAGKSYHGRGPIQLSYNYNYGLFSSIIYGDKNVLLENPDRLTESGKLGFMTGMLFWMTPQPPKPSSHDVMVGNWIPSAQDKAKGLSPAGFGVTIMIINGGLEGNLSTDDGRIARRVGHYLDITEKMGVDVSGEKLDTLGMKPF